MATRGPPAYPGHIPERCLVAAVLDELQKRHSVTAAGEIVREPAIAEFYSPRLHEPLRAEAARRIAEIDGLPPAEAAAYHSRRLVLANIVRLLDAEIAGGCA